MISFESKLHLEARSRLDTAALISDRDSIRDVVSIFFCSLCIPKKVKGILIDILDQTKTPKSGIKRITISFYLT